MVLYKILTKRYTRIITTLPLVHCFLSTAQTALIYYVSYVQILLSDIGIR